MSYTVDQKIGKYIYVYEVESYWDPQKKQPRQKRRYLGKRDAQSGEILTPYKGITPRAARDYGQIYLLEKLAERIGLLSVLRKVFPEEAEVLAQLAFFQVCEARPLYLCQGVGGVDLFCKTCGYRLAKNESFFETHWSNGSAKRQVFRAMGSTAR